VLRGQDYHTSGDGNRIVWINCGNNFHGETEETLRNALSSAISSTANLGLSRPELNPDLISDESAPERCYGLQSDFLWNINVPYSTQINSRCTSQAFTLEQTDSVTTLEEATCLSVVRYRRNVSVRSWRFVAAECLYYEALFVIRIKRSNCFCESYTQ
jgi:hypothetical protein